MENNTEFKAITTQEEFDAAIKARIERCKTSTTEEVTKKFEGWVSPDDAKKTTDQIEALTKEYEESKKTIADLTAKNSAYEAARKKTQIAQDCGLPIELADRISGETDDEMKKDAEKLAAIFKKSGHQPRPRQTEVGDEMSGVEKEFYKKNPGLNKSSK